MSDLCLLLNGLVDILFYVCNISGPTDTPAKPNLQLLEKNVFSMNDKIGI